MFVWLLCRGLEYSGSLSNANCGLKDQVGHDYCKMSLVSTQADQSWLNKPL